VALASERGGRQDFGLSYATAGLAWQAEYRVDARAWAAPAACRSTARRWW
jgi:hypothetical protein